MPIICFLLTPHVFILDGKHEVKKDADKTAETSGEVAEKDAEKNSGESESSESEEGLLSFFVKRNNFSLSRATSNSVSRYGRLRAWYFAVKVPIFVADDDDDDDDDDDEDSDGDGLVDAVDPDDDNDGILDDGKPQSLSAVCLQWVISAGHTFREATN